MHKKKVLATVFLTILIEVIGFSMIIPILPFMFTDPESSSYVLAPGTSQNVGYLLLGALFSLYSFAQFFANPVFGQFSDKYGRRPMLKGAIFGTGISNFMFAFGFMFASLPTLFIARFIDGITGGSIAIAQSVVADISDKSDRAKNFGIAGAAFGLGFMIGPFLGGILSNADLVPWFGPFFAFMVSGAFSLLNVVVLHKLLPETSPMDKSLNVKIFKSVRNIGQMIQSRANRVLYGSAFIYSFAFTLFTTFLGVFLLQRFGYTETNIGFLFFYIGIIGILSQTQLVTWADARFSQYKITISGALVMALALGLITFSDQTLILLLLILFFSCANSLLRTGLSTITAESAEAKDQGKVQGFKASADALGQTVPAVLAGVLAALYGAAFPLQLAAIIFVGLAALMFIFRTSLMTE